MRQLEVRVPDIGGASGVEVIEICVKSGETVAADQSLIVLESDKATMEIPSPQAGVVGDIRVKTGDKVSEGDLILVLLQGAEPESTSAGGGDSPLREEEASVVGTTTVSGDGPGGATAGREPGDGSATGPEAGAAGTRGEVREVAVPDLGGAHDVTVIELSVATGAMVDREQPLIVLESDKATMEIPSPLAGRIEELLVAVGAKVNEGDLIARIRIAAEGAGRPESAALSADSEGGSGAAVDAQAEAAARAMAGQLPASARNAKGAAVPGGNKLGERMPGGRLPGSGGIAPGTVTHGGAVSLPGATAAPVSRTVHAGPAVRRLAREFGVDLTQVTGSGMKGRITREDVQRFVKQGMQQVQAGAMVAPGGALGLPVVELPDFAQFGRVERRQMSRLQRLTADNMTKSWLTVPQVTQFEEADVTDLESFRRSQQAAGDKRGVKLTTLPFILKACAHVLASLPQFNVSLDPSRNEIIQKHYLNIGVAVDTPAGLVVPVLRDVQGKGLWELAGELADLANRARERKLKPAEMQGGCFTVSSLGSIGGTAFTPIVNAPEVAILGLSRAQQRPVYQDGGFVPRLLLPLSLSYDHRVINGAEAARFTALLAELLGDLRKLLL